MELLTCPCCGEESYHTTKRENAAVGNKCFKCENVWAELYGMMARYSYYLKCWMPIENPKKKNNPISEEELSTLKELMAPCETIESLFKLI